MAIGWITESAISLEPRVGHTCLIHQLKAHIFLHLMTFSLNIVLILLKPMFQISYLGLSPKVMRKNGKTLLILSGSIFYIS